MGLFKLLIKLVCPECLGGDRWSPCPTCGEKGEISPGSNSTPRGVGIRGTGNAKQAIPKCKVQHDRHWSKDRGGLIS